MGQNKDTGICIKLSMGCFKKNVEMCGIYYEMCKERIKGRDEGGLEGTRWGEEGKGAKSHWLCVRQPVGQCICLKKSSA